MSSKGFNPYITVADVSPLYLFTLLENLKKNKLNAQNEIVFKLHRAIENLEMDGHCGLTWCPMHQEI